LSWQRFLKPIVAAAASAQPAVKKTRFI